MSRPPLRVVVCSPGAEGDAQGADAVARALRDAGHEVVHAGSHVGPEQVAQTAIQEDVALVVVCLAGPVQDEVVVILRDLLRARDAEDVVVRRLDETPAELAAWVADRLDPEQT